MKPYDDLHSTDPAALKEKYGETIIATYLVGSRDYKTTTPESDEDYRGIFVLPSRYYLSIREPVNQVSDERHNTTYYTHKRFLELATTANPKIIEMLFLPEDCRVFESPLMQRLLKSRTWRQLTDCLWKPLNSGKKRWATRLEYIDLCV